MGRTRSYPGSSTSLPVVLAVLGSAALSAPPASAQVTRVWDGLDGDLWQGPAGDDNWTDETGAINVPWADGGIAVFSGSGLDFFGDVIVDTSLGAVRASGIEVTNGYYFISSEFDPITGRSDPIELVGAPTSTIRVDDNAGASISSDLTGNTRLRKTGPGTLILYGLNSYSGGTDIDGGTLAVGIEVFPPLAP